MQNGLSHENKTASFIDGIQTSILLATLCLLLTLSSFPSWANETTAPISHNVSDISLININHATVSELTELIGIGPGKAEAIVKYRAEHGPFRSVEELVAVKGIGLKTLEKNRDLIVAH